MRFFEKVQHNLNKQIQKNLPQYTNKEIEYALNNYVWPDCQSLNPDRQHDKYAVHHRLLSTFNEIVKLDSPNHHFILLADAGMGKSAFLLNYFNLNHTPFHVELLPFCIKNLEDQIKNISNQSNCILLLDGFNEDVKAIKHKILRLNEVLELTKNFHRVLITCRTRFFPTTADIIKFNEMLYPFHENTNGATRTRFQKIYLTPWREEQISEYVIQKCSGLKKNALQQMEIQVLQNKKYCTSPSMLYWLTDVLDSEMKYENLYQFYDAVVNSILNRDCKSLIDKNAVQDFLTRLAVVVFSEREQRQNESLSLTEVTTVADKFSIDLAELPATSNLICGRLDKDNYKFIHRPLMEFLFAKSIIAQDNTAFKVPLNHWTDIIEQFIIEYFGSRSLALLRLFVRFENDDFNFGNNGNVFKINSFELSTHPVTNFEYEQFDPSHRSQRNEYSDQDDQPVVNVSWEDANNYCQWLSDLTGDRYRLPTEAEWEYAASGGGKRIYPWGNAEPTIEHANYRESKIDMTTPVGTYPAGKTPEGLFDMAGNVWEWCHACLDKDRQEYLARGGAYYGLPINLRCTYRGWRSPAERSVNVGFRVVRAVKVIR